jgi:hypothetical protein
MIRFLAEIAFRSEALIFAVPANGATDDQPVGVSRIYNVYELYMGPPPTSSYWLDWGGTYDYYQGTNIELYYTQFLTRVYSIADVQAQEFSLYIFPDGSGRVWFNIPRQPWLYADYEYEGEDVIPFLSTSLDSRNPSSNVVRGVKARAILQIPSVNTKLSDNISGLILNQSFSLTFDNSDGYFDDETEWDLFNTPVYLKRANVENPTYEDFRTIKRGHAESTSTSFNDFTIEVADNLRALTEPACDVIRSDRYPGWTLLPEAVDKPVPVLYGTAQVPVLKIQQGLYLSVESAGATIAVYDRDGNQLGFTAYGEVFSLNDPSQDAATALVTGYTDNRIGSIIKDIITRKTSVIYDSASWNQGEVENYITNGPRINLFINGGDVKGAVNKAIKSDMAYFIQQSDGRFTIRKWGWDYNTINLTPQVLTKTPAKEYGAAQKNYFSSCIIGYSGGRSYLYEDRENEAEDIYRKRHLANFETDLTTEDEARALAVALANRFLIMRQTIRTAAGLADPTGIEILDKVILDLTINKRQFSRSKTWVVKEIDHAQDTLVLEEFQGD